MGIYTQRGRHLGVFIFSFLLMMATLWLPRTASDSTELEKAQMGAPVPFVVQDLTTYDHPLPHTYTFQSPWENPTQIIWGRLLMSLLLVFLLLELLAFLFFRSRRSEERRGRVA